MKLLLDTHLLLWAARWPERVPSEARSLIEDAGNDLVFSVVSLWEITIKSALGRADFRIDPRRLRRNLLDNGYAELPIAVEHILAVANFPLIHKDPFDRLLVAQSLVEGITLLTADAAVARYPAPVRKV